MGKNESKRSAVLGSWPDLRRYAPTGSSQLFGILGDPLEHSMSPSVHTAVLRSLGRDAIYIPVPVAKTELRSFLRLAPAMGFVGLNVTTPFKEVVRKLVEPRDAETERVGMINTVLLDKSGETFRWGAGTDGHGVRRWIETHVPTARRIGVLGFGATARSVVHQLWAGPRSHSQIRVVTRRPGPVRRQLTRWTAESPGARDARRGKRSAVLRGAPPSIHSWADLPPDVDLWISTLPPGAQLPQSFWEASKGAVLLDMNYGEGRAHKAMEAQARGILAADGLGPLLEQAALSLSLWLEEDVEVGRFLRAAGVRESRLRPQRASGRPQRRRDR